MDLPDFLLSMWRSYSCQQTIWQFNVQLFVLPKDRSFLHDPLLLDSFVLCFTEASWRQNLLFTVSPRLMAHSIWNLHKGTKFLTAVAPSLAFWLEALHKERSIHISVPAYWWWEETNQFHWDMDAKQSARLTQRWTCLCTSAYVAQIILSKTANDHIPGI